MWAWSMLYVINKINFTPTLCVYLNKMCFDCCISSQKLTDKSTYHHPHLTISAPKIQIHKKNYLLLMVFLKQNDVFVWTYIKWYDLELRRSLIFAFIPHVVNVIFVCPVIDWQRLQQAHLIFCSQEVRVWSVKGLFMFRVSSDNWIPHKIPAGRFMFLAAGTIILLLMSLNLGLSGIFHNDSNVNSFKNVFVLHFSRVTVFQHGEIGGCSRECW